MIVLVTSPCEPGPRTQDLEIGDGELQNLKTATKTEAAIDVQNPPHAYSAPIHEDPNICMPRRIFEV